MYPGLVSDSGNKVREGGKGGGVEGDGREGVSGGGEEQKVDFVCEAVRKTLEELGENK